jgi:hypothetical protein
MKRFILAMALGWAPAALGGCLPTLPGAVERTPVRWIVVEKSVGEVIPDGRVGDGQVDPSAIVLTMQPLYPEDLAWQVVVDLNDYFVEVLEISPRTQASPGETVTAKVHVARAKPDEVYRLVAKASRPDVQLIGASEQIVHGGAPALFRFTSLSSGPGGIALGVEKLEQGDRRLQ